MEKERWSKEHAHLVWSLLSVLKGNPKKYQKESQEILGKNPNTKLDPRVGWKKKDGASTPGLEAALCLRGNIKRNQKEFPKKFRRK